MTHADYLAAVAALMADPQTRAWAWSILLSDDQGANSRGAEPYAIEGRIIGGGGATSVRITPARGAHRGFWTTSIASTHGNKPTGIAVYTATAAITLARAAIPARLRSARDALNAAQAAFDNLAADAIMVRA
jgi:hypothetical protein